MEEDDQELDRDTIGKKVNNINFLNYYLKYLNL
jgi:hypothetical protein